MRYLTFLFLVPLFFFDVSVFAQRFPRPAPIYRPPTTTTRPGTPTVTRPTIPTITRPPKLPPRSQPTITGGKTTVNGQKPNVAERNKNTNVVPLRTVTIPQKTSSAVLSARASNTAKLAQLRSSLANRRNKTALAGGGGRKPPGGGGNVAANDNNPPRKSFEDILKTTTPGRSTRGKTTQHISSGGMNKALKDFNSLEISKIKPIQTKYGPGKTGILKDGRKITVRPDSSDGRPTIEVINNDGSIDKIRYNP